MKKKNKLDFGIAIALLFISSVIILLPYIKVTDVKLVMIVLFILYTVLYFIKFAFNDDKKDFEGLFTSIISLTSSLVILLIEKELTANNLALTLFGWITFESLIKLKKCDYYHDRNQKSWMIKMITLIIFIISGLLTVVSLYYSQSVQLLVIGFFTFIHGILELAIPFSEITK